MLAPVKHVVTIVVMPLLCGASAANASQSLPAGIAEMPNGWVCGSASALFDYSIERNSVRINNFLISDIKPGFGASGPSVQFGYSVTNRGTKPIHLSAQVVGFAGDGGLLFALSASPSFGLVTDGANDQAKGSVLASAGTASKASKICVLIVGDF